MTGLGYTGSLEESSRGLNRPASSPADTLLMIKASIDARLLQGSSPLSAKKALEQEDTAQADGMLSRGWTGSSVKAGNASTLSFKRGAANNGRAQSARQR